MDECDIYGEVNTFDHTLTENDFRDGLLSAFDGFLTYLHPFT